MNEHFVRREVLVIAEPDSIRKDLFSQGFERIVFGPRTMLKQQKTILEQLALLWFSLRVILLINLIRPKVVFLAWADSLVKNLERARRVRLLPPNRVILLTRRTFLFDGERLNCHIRLRDTSLLSRVVGFLPELPDAFPENLRERYSFVPFEPGIATEPKHNSDSAQEAYLFSGGGYGRDYPSLLTAARGLPIDVRIYTWLEPPFGLRGEWPPNCKVFPIHHFYCTPGDPRQAESLSDWLEIISRALFVVLPLESGPELRGLTVAMQTLRLGKALVINWHPDLAPYVKPGENALVVPPDDPDALRFAITRLLEDPNLRTRLETNARASSASFSTASIKARIMESCREELQRSPEPA